jgi:hypothetical protein
LRGALLRARAGAPPHTSCVSAAHTRSRPSSTPPPPDKLFRVNDVAKRRKYAALVEGVEGGGGEALVFSSMHVSGGRGGRAGTRGSGTHAGRRCRHGDHSPCLLAALMQRVFLAPCLVDGWTLTPPPPPDPTTPGEQLNQLSGIAAVLRFPLPELEDQELIEEA